ncbi:hypothetical protein H4V96_001608 [Janthinobacterium sp. CG_23.4]|nr:hypothetical protein [Janthinobacterium sp. CG_23.4]
MQSLSMTDSNFPSPALPCMAYTASIIHKHQEPT